MRNRRTLLLPAALFCLLGSGCIAQVDYKPNSGVVDELGERDAKILFAEVLTRARRPRITDVGVTANGFWVTVSGHVVVGWYGIGVDNRWRFAWNNISAINVYVNNRVFIMGNSGQKLATIDFQNQKDCLTFADLVASFKVPRIRGGGDPRQPEPPANPPPASPPPPENPPPANPPPPENPPPANPPPANPPPENPPPESSGKVCPDCETPIPKGATTCPGCGRRILSSD